MSFMCFAAEASAALPDSAYHARVAREAADQGGYAFNAAAFPWLFDTDACAAMAIELDKLTPLSLNQRAVGKDADDASSSNSATLSSNSAGSGGLELTMHESHSGALIGSVVWEGGRVLAWVLESMHSRVRELRPDGSGFVDQPLPSAAAAGPISAAPAPAPVPLPSSASSFTSASHSEYLHARAAGAYFDIPRDFLAGVRVLELGAGTGITGLACAKLGAAQVVLTDIAQLLPLMRENVRRNCPGLLRDSEAWRETERNQNGAAAAAAPAPDAEAPSASASLPVPESDPLPCSNCDAPSRTLWRCASCDGGEVGEQSQSLCAACDAAFHRPASKAKHQRHRVTAGGDADASAAAAVAAASSAAASPAPLVPLPAHCDVYVEELLWGEHSSVSSLPLCLRAPFDVVIMADVVYDAYSTSGVGSDGCDNFRRLFSTLTLLCPEGSSTTILLTYTPRRAPEKAFFDLLATAFVWTAHQATALLPDHPGLVDERIWIYHLHRSKLAGKLRAVRQQTYIHQAHYGSDLQVALRQEQQQQRPAQAGAAGVTAAGPVNHSASSIPASSTASSPPAANETSRSSNEVDSSTLPAPSLPQNITPTLTRYLENEEGRQDALVQDKLRRRAAKRATMASPAAAAPADALQAASSSPSAAPM